MGNDNIIISKTAKELEQLTQENWSNPDQLVKILSEVTYRKRQRSLKLSHHHDTFRCISCGYLEFYATGKEGKAR